MVNLLSGSTMIQKTRFMRASQSILNTKSIKYEHMVQRTFVRHPIAWQNKTILNCNIIVTRTLIDCRLASRLCLLTKTIQHAAFDRVTRVHSVKRHPSRALAVSRVLMLRSLRTLEFKHKSYFVFRSTLRNV